PHDTRDGAADHTVLRHATDLLAVLDAIDDERPAHVVGHSFGGFVVRAAALARPVPLGDADRQRAEPGQRPPPPAAGRLRQDAGPARVRGDVAGRAPADP